MCKPMQPQEGEQLQEGMAVPQVPVLPLPLHPASAAKQYQEALQGAQQAPIEVMQHMAHMQALLASASSAHLQACPLYANMHPKLHHQVPFHGGEHYWRNCWGAILQWQSGFSSLFRSIMHRGEQA